MTGENINHLNPPSTPGTTSWTHEYDPFARGRFPVGVRTIQALDMVRNRLFPCEVWYPAAAQHAGQDLALTTQDFFTVPPNDTLRSQMAVRDAAAQPGRYTLILFSHSSGDRWRQSTFLCTHLSSREYVVATLDHSEVIAPELTRRESETDEQKTARVAAWIANLCLIYAFSSISAGVIDCPPIRRILQTKRPLLLFFASPEEISAGWDLSSAGC